jgi:hypothetical protein
LLFDHDDAGDSAARALTRKSPHRCRRLYLPPGIKDVSDLHGEHKSVLDWLKSEFTRFGWNAKS